MSTRPEVPQFGALLREHIDAIAPAAQPAFLAGLERSAAARYRRWADELPEVRERLIGCAQAEDRIADIVLERFPISAQDRARVDEALPGAIAVYYDVFEPYSVTDQLYLQSQAEIQGSHAWVRLAADIDDEATVAALRECTDLELQSSVEVTSILEFLEAS